MMEIQQHDGVLVEVAGSRQGFAKLLRRKRGVGEGRGCALDVVCIPSLAPLFIGEGGRGPAPSR